MIFGKFRPALLLMIVILSVVSFLPCLTSVVLVRATDFTVAPTFDLTTSSNIAGATNAVYEFHGADPDSSMGISSYVCVIPAGYVVNPIYLTTTPGIFVMNGSGGTIGSPPSGTGNATTTTTSGTFNVYVKGELVGTSTLVAPTSTSNGSLTFVFPARAAGFTPNGYVDLTTVPGLLFNPTNPGVYTWSARATPGGSPPNDAVDMNARSGYSQSITIATAAVPEFGSAAFVSVVAAMAVVTVGLVAFKVKKPKRSR